MLFPDFSFLGEGLRTRCKSTKQMKLLVENPGFILFEILKKQIMNYQETLNWLFAQLPMYQREGQAAYKANLDNTLQLDEYFRHPKLLVENPGFILFAVKKKLILQVINRLFMKADINVPIQLPMYQREGQAAYKANLDNTLQLDEYFRHPHKNFKTIHVAGTNGKGSVSHMLASILQQAGYKTGLYTSPHLKDFRERIKNQRRNGQ